ncbi:MAG: tetratricopeptide repeat protein [Planctomycetales bacterium]|nr:tetratricopeptide repeat protein [Planctomycetales bacterium]
MKIKKQQSELTHRFTARVIRPLLGACLISATVGCQTFGRSGTSRSWFPGIPFRSTAGTESSTSPMGDSSVDGDADDGTSPKVASAGGSLLERMPGTNRLVGFVTGKHEDLPRAKQLYVRADALFKEAARAPKATRTMMFADAAGLFEDAGDEAPGSGLQQDALFMQGESLFFANDLNGARDAFETLQKKFPRNRHGDRAAARLFSISKYWIDVSKSGNDAWYTLNLFDSTRPLRDANGHAVKVLDQIRYDDPTGKLADDATMAAAAEHIRNEQYDKADEFLTDLRETFTDSDHLFLAHLLGIRCKLEIYAGPRYSERVLDEADTLVEQTRRRFPNELREEKYNEMLARAAAEIDYHKAEKLAYRARYRERQKEYGAASELYRKILRDHPTTPQAEQARTILAKIEKLPPSPTKSLAFLTKVFPSSQRSSPLETVESQQPAAEPPPETTGKKILR